MAARPGRSPLADRKPARSSLRRYRDSQRTHPRISLHLALPGCAESLASENASRLAAMQRADKNINELLDDLNGTFHRVRQGGIDEELFDVISGFEALNVEEE